jgi:drug/metabolite transporter (DMT)-like permease
VTVEGPPSPRPLSPRWRIGIGLVLATAVVSGISTFVNLYAVQGTNSDAFVTMRNALVVLLLIPFGLLTVRTPRPALGATDWARLVVIGLVGGAIPFLLFFHGLQLAAAQRGGPTASFIYRTLFLMATVLGVVALHERFHLRAALAAGLLLLGNLLLLALSSPVWTDGSLYVFAATALWAGEYTLSKHTLRRLPWTTVGLGRMGFGALFLIAYLGISGQLGAAAGMTGGQWEWAAVSALLLTAFVATWYAGLREVDLGVATSVLVLGFPITWLLTVLVRGVPSTGGEAFGAAAIVVGTTVAIWGVVGRRTARPVPGATPDAPTA